MSTVQSSGCLFFETFLARRPGSAGGSRSHERALHVHVSEMILNFMLATSVSRHKELHIEMRGSMTGDGSMALDGGDGAPGGTRGSWARDFGHWVSLACAIFIFGAGSKKIESASREEESSPIPPGRRHAPGKRLFVMAVLSLSCPVAVAGSIWMYLAPKKGKAKEARRMAIASSAVTRAQRRPRRGIAPGAPNEPLCVVTSHVRPPTLGRACGWWLLHHVLSWYLLH